MTAVLGTGTFGIALLHTLEGASFRRGLSGVLIVPVVTLLWASFCRASARRCEARARRLP